MFLPVIFLQTQIRQSRSALDEISLLRDAADADDMAATWGRLHAALSAAGDFLSRASVKQCRKSIGRLRKRLLAARDAEARMETVCDALAGSSDARFPQGITRLVSVLDQERHVARAKVAKAARRLAKRETLSELRAAAKRAHKRLSKDHGGPGVEDARWRALGRIERQLERVLAHRPAPADLAKGEHCRAVCAELRRFRDMLEVGRRVWQCDLEDSIAGVNRLLMIAQRQRDCKAAGKCAAKFLAEDLRRTGRSHDGRGSSKTATRELLRTMEERHRQCCRKLAATWHDLDQRQFWDVLRAALHCESKDSPDAQPAVAGCAVVEQALDEAKDPAGNQCATLPDPQPRTEATAGEASSQAVAADESQFEEEKLWFWGPAADVQASDRPLTLPGPAAIPGPAGPLAGDDLPTGIERGPGLLLWPYENERSPAERYCTQLLRNEGRDDLAAGAAGSGEGRLEFPPSAEMVIQYSRQFYQFLPLNCSETGDWELLRRYLREGIGKRCTLFYFPDADAGFQAVKRILSPSAIAG